MTKVFSFDEAWQQSLEYFNGAEYTTSVFLSKYALRDNDLNILEPTPDYMHDRLASEFARIDADKYGLNYDERFAIYRASMDKFARIVPQGSPMAAIGNKYQLMSASNCVVVKSPEDSIEGIFSTALELAQLMKRRCGVGLDISSLRPDGTNVNNAARTTSGAWSFADLYSYVTRMIGQCIAKGERVLTKNGLTSIEDIIPGTNVWTRKGWVKVNSVQKNGPKTIFKITSKEGFSIKTSEEHIFLTSENGVLEEKKLKDFEIGDSIVLLPGTNTQKQYVELNDFTYIKKLHNNSNRLNEDIKLPKQLDEKLSYVLGYMFGDGCTEFDKFNEPLNISVACGHKWPKIQENYEKIVFDIFGFKIKSYHGDGAVNKVCIGSKVITGWLEQNNILKPKSHEIFIPNVIWQSPSSVQLAFLSGFFDADGYNSGSKKGYVFSTVNHKFAKDIQTMLMANGIISKLFVEDRSELNWRSLFTVSITGRHAQSKFVETVGAFSIKIKHNIFVSERDNYLTPYKASTLNVSHNKYDFIPDETQYVSANAYLQLPQDKRNGELLIKSEIIAIEEVGTEDTYDLVLEEEHLFWCEGFYVHNSGRRGALMVTIDVHHPDVMKFITMKHDKTKVTGANISVRLSNEFLKAVETDSLYEQRWPCEGEPKIKKMVSAREVWNEIIESATTTAEPGLIMWDTMLANLPAHCYPQYKTISTNPSLRGDTLVLTSEGVQPIKNLDGKSILVRNLFGEWKEAKAFISGKNQQLVKITFTNGQYIFCTKEHKWPILNTQGHVYDGRNGEPNKKPSIDLKRKDKIPFPSFDKPINNKLCSFTNEDGFMLGWLYGDGWKSYHKTNEVDQIGFIFNENEIDIGNRVLSYTNKLAKTPSTLRQDHDSAAKTFCSTDKNVLAQFNKLGADFKTNGIPSTVWNGNSEFISGFIDGLFSSDAYVRVTNKLSTSQIILVSAHEELIHDVQKLLSFYGVKSNIRKSVSKTSSFPNKKVYDKIYTRYDLIISGIYTKKFIKHFTLSSVDKKIKCEILSSIDSQSHDTNKTSYANNREYLVVRDVELTSLYEDVYDITVYDETHTFLTECGITGNCSEIALSAYDSCRLVSINLTGYVRNAFEPNVSFDYSAFEDDVRIAMQMVDNIVDIELELINKIKAVCQEGSETALWDKLYKAGEEGRRTGLGSHALGDTLAQLRIRYDSEEALTIIDKIYSTFRNAAYEASVDLAKERGAFPAFNWELEKNCEFIQRLPNSIKKQMAKTGRRNVSILTQAPTGSTSAISKVGEFNSFYTSSGIEPVHSNYSTRRKKINANDQNVRVDFVDVVGDKWQEYKIYHPNVLNYREKFGTDSDDDLPDYFVTADKIDGDMRIKLQGLAQTYIDHSISSTINLPKGTKSDVVGRLYMNAWKHNLKGVTVYVEGSRDGVILSESETESNDRVIPERQMTLKSETHKIKIDTGDSELKNAYITISFFPDTSDPYEVFINAPVASNMKDIQILEAASRLASLALRHGVPVEFVSKQLEKIDGQYLYSIPVSIAKALRSYIKTEKTENRKIQSEESPKKIPAVKSEPKTKLFDTTPVQEKEANKTLRKIACKNPESCNSEKIYEEGCVRCTECPWSGCS
jgi:ribonucleoside-diphosphate reductase alpha chain